MKNNNFISESIDEPFDILDIFRILIGGKWIIACATISVSIIAIIYSLSLPNIYQSKAILVPVNSSSSISGALQSYSSVASLVGVSLPSEDGDSNSVQAIEKLGSLSFFKNDVLSAIFLPNLMAIKSWDHNSNKLIFASPSL